MKSDMQIITEVIGVPVESTDERPIMMTIGLQRKAMHEFLREFVNEVNRRSGNFGANYRATMTEVLKEMTGKADS